MAGDVIDFEPLFPDEDETTILTRLRGWANEGLDPVVNVDEWADTREGGHWHAHVMPQVREFAKVYDVLGTEVVAAGFPVWAWGTYLDDHAEVQDVVRLAATSAEGIVRFTGANGTVIAAGTTVGVEPVGPDDVAPEYTVVVGGTIAGGFVDLLARATERGVGGNVAAHAVTVPGTPLPGVVLDNAAPMAGGTEAETDEALRERVLATFEGQGAGNRRDYVRWARAWAGVGRATVIPLWNGPGTVKVVVMTAAGGPVAASVVTSLQANLDPIVGKGEGTAPVGAIVTVATATILNVDVTASVKFEPGYSLAGTGGTVALRPAITAALRDYIQRVEPGGEIVFEQVRGRIVTVTGVHDVTATTVEGGVVNVPVAANPAQVPVLVEPVVLTEV